MIIPDYQSLLFLFPTSQSSTGAKENGMGPRVLMPAQGQSYKRGKHLQPWVPFLACTQRAGVPWSSCSPTAFSTCAPPEEEKHSDIFQHASMFCIKIHSVGGESNRNIAKMVSCYLTILRLQTLVRFQNEENFCSRD